VEVQGKFEGSIACRPDLTISEGAKVTGNIRSPHIVIQGTFQGERISASRQLDILEGAAIQAEQVKQPDLIVLSSKVKTGDISSGKIK
jgi:cytoskeletal protein CcmA (bactofilin family)